MIRSILSTIALVAAIASAVPAFADPLAANATPAAATQPAPAASPDAATGTAQDRDIAPAGLGWG